MYFDDGSKVNGVFSFIYWLLDNLWFDVVLTQFEYAFNTMLDVGVDMDYYFKANVGEGILDAECIFEMLLC